VHRSVHTLTAITDYEVLSAQSNNGPNLDNSRRAMRCGPEETLSTWTSVQTVKRLNVSKDSFSVA